MHKRCLYLNNMSEKCGIYQYGRRVYEILNKSQRHAYMYVEVSSVEEYNETIKNIEYDCIIYNYSNAYFGWLNDGNIQHDKKNICIYHEFNVMANFDVYINTDSTYRSNDGWYSLPRPLFENIPLVNIVHNQIPVIGSFGLALPQKGFERIVKMVNREFDDAVIRLHIPNSQFGDPDGMMAKNIIDGCNSVKRKQGVSLEITGNFLDDKGMLNFLNGNDINAFMYDGMDSRGLSSVIDYALSVDRPIGISDSSVFRHIYNDGICLYQNSISEVMRNGTAYVAKLRNAWSNQKLRDRMDSIVDERVIEI